MSEQGIPGAEVARRLGVSDVAVYYWLDLYRRGGVDALKPGASNPRLTGAEKEERERRRMEAARMFEEGLPAAEVARRLGVRVMAVRAWRRRYEVHGIAGLRQNVRPRRSALELERLRLEAAEMFEEGLPDTEVVARLGVKHASVTGWRRIWRDQGVEG
jgi:transposase